MKPILLEKPVRDRETETDTETLIADTSFKNEVTFSRTFFSEYLLDLL